MKKILTSLLVFICSIGVIGPQAAVQASDMSFSVHANLPKNQKNKKATYFDLKVDPGQKQTISVTLKNTSNKKETILATVNNATTNQNGVIDYTKHQAKKDESLKVGIEDIVKDAKQEITLGPKEKKEVTFQLELPAEPFKGIVLGGIHLMKKDQGEKQKSQSVMIQNRYAYVIGLVLTEKEEAIKPNLRLLGAQADLMNYRQVVTATLQNDQPVIMSDLKVHATVTKKGDKKPYKSTEKSGMSMAPNTNFNFPVPWGGQQIEPGEYTMNIRAEAEKGKYKWNLSKDFVVKKDKADEVNKEAVQEPSKGFPLWGYIAIGVGLLAFLIILYLWLQLRKARKNK